MDFAGESLEDRECLADSLRDGLMNKIREIWAGSPFRVFLYVSITAAPSASIICYFEPLLAWEYGFRMALALFTISTVAWFFAILVYFINKWKSKHGKEKNKYLAVVKRLLSYFVIVLFIPFIVLWDENLIVKFGFIVLFLFALPIHFLSEYVSNIAQKEKIVFQYENKILPIDIDNATLKCLHSSKRLNKTCLKVYLILSHPVFICSVSSVIGVVVMLFIYGER